MRALSRFRETALPHRDNSRRSPCIGRSEKGARTCLIEQGDEQRNLRAVPRSTSHDRHLDLVDVEIATRARYESVIRLHVRPLLRSLPVAKLTGETGDAFQAASALPRALRPQRDGRAA